MIPAHRGLLSFLLAGLAAQTAIADDRSWTDRIQLSGSADVGFFGGGRDSVNPNDGFDLWDARAFVDAELSDAIPFAGRTLVRNTGFTFEWNIVRNGSVANDVGLAYLDFEGVVDSPWLNVRVGRFQIPFGEAYKLYSKGYASRTFSQQPVGGPWWWDEGVMLHGGAPNGRLGYVASGTNGDTGFNDVGGDIQLVLKLWAQPFDWLYLSASGLWTSDLDRVEGALWLGEGWARPFGDDGVPLPNVDHGQVVPDDPDGIGQTWAVGLDAVLTPVDGVRIWLAGGRYDITSTGASLYDRALWYWIGEAVLGGQLVSAALHPLFAGVRVDGVGTFDQNRGYLLDVRYTGQFDFNMESIVAYTGVLGCHLGEYVTVRAEYSHRDIELVRGSALLLPGRTGDSDVYTLEFGLHY